MTTKTRCIVAFGLLLAVSPAASEAQGATSRVASPSPVIADVPQIVVDGFGAYRKGGLRSAIEMWLKGSPVAATANVDQIVAGVAQIEAAYGRMTGYDVLRVVHIGTKVRRVYFVVQYDRGPLYGFIDCYQTGQGWVVPGFLTNAQPSVILPPDLLTGEVNGGRSSAP